MTLARQLMASAALIALTMPAARAADLPPIYETPIYQDVPEVQPVEIGSGWYLRGDVSYGFSGDLDAKYQEYRPDFATYPGDFFSGYNAYQYDTFSAPHEGFTLEDSFEFGVGFGYQFTDFFRGDLTARYYKLDVEGSDKTESCYDASAAQGFDTSLLECDSSLSAEGNALELMANAYVDLGTIAGFTPYAGAGAGAVRVTYEDVSGRSRCAYAGAVCAPAYYDFDASYKGEDSWRFAYSLMAGVSYDVSRNLKIDVGYRFTDVDGGKMFSFDGAGANGATAEDDGFQRHSISAGLRYALW
ncbi:outer membrane protein [Aurantimonas sp. A2-1-M11]|uniref:outer membrane protein n=1 Tax=Aurantimonas sp. A2-1-M11 TaxID=3113712 RepID=UPI002F93F36D